MLRTSLVGAVWEKREPPLGRSGGSPYRSLHLMSGGGRANVCTEPLHLLVVNIAATPVIGS